MNTKSLAPAFEVGELLYTNTFHSQAELAVYVVDKATPVYRDRELKVVAYYRYRMLRLFQISISQFFKYPEYRANPVTTKTCMEHAARHSLGIIRDDLFRLRFHGEQMRYHRLCVRNVVQTRPHALTSSFSKFEDIDKMNKHFQDLLTRQSRVRSRAQRLGDNTDFGPLHEYFRSRIEAVNRSYLEPANMLSSNGLITIENTLN